MSGAKVGGVGSVAWRDRAYVAREQAGSKQRYVLLYVRGEGWNRRK